jgi:transcriptional regulator with XRE-family HTH domain
VDIGGVGRFLRESRRGLGLTQSYVAESLGVSAQAVSKWERGENLPDISFFPDLSKILQISIDEILAAGRAEKSERAEDRIQKLVDDGVFGRVLGRMAGLERMADLDMDLDFFVYLSGGQKLEFIETILKIPGYGLVLDEILPYSAASHKTAVLSHILANRDYDLLEQIAVYMNNDMKAAVLTKLLAERRFDIIEDIITTFNRKHRELIVDFFVNSPDYADILENFIPFLDRNQIKKIVKEAKL